MAEKEILKVITVSSRRRSGSTGGRILYHAAGRERVAGVKHSVTLAPYELQRRPVPRHQVSEGKT